MKKNLVIYDGDCGICEKSRELIEKLDWLNLFECQPFHNHEAYEEFALTPKECEKELKLITTSGSIYGGAEAVTQICLKLPLFFLVGVLLWLPPVRPLARWLYSNVANNRHKISARCGLKNKQ